MDLNASFARLYDHIDADAGNMEEPQPERRPATERRPSLKRTDSMRRGRRSRENSQEPPKPSRSKSRSRARSKSRGREPASERKSATDDPSRSPSSVINSALARPGFGKALSCRELHSDDSLRKKNARDLLADDSSRSSSSKENDPFASSGPPSRPRIGRSTSCRELRTHMQLTSESPMSTVKPKIDVKPEKDEDMEQLQVENKLYKEEFQRAQKEKKQIKKTKDAEIEKLNEEIAELRKEVRNSDNENRKLKSALAEGAGGSYRVKVLEEENSRLQAELKETVERASTMVREREAAIDELMQELEKVKNESIQTRTMFDATLYKNKLKLEELDREKDAYAQRVAQLELSLKSK